MSLLTRLFGSKDPEIRPIKDESYTVTNPAIFNKVVMFGGKVTPGEELIAEGKGDGGHPAFRRAATLPADAPHDTRQRISTTVAADHKTPAELGLTYTKR